MSALLRPLWASHRPVLAGLRPSSGGAANLDFMKDAKNPLSGTLAFDYGF
jgi:hypothetical protein